MKIKELLKNKKVMIASAVVLLIVVVVIIVARRKKKAETADSSSKDSSSKDSLSILDIVDPLSKYPEASFPLTPYSKAGEYSAEAGSYGQQIAILQKICNEKFGKNLDVDGKYGPKSENAFMNCFGSPFAPPYSEEVYNGFIITHGQGIV